MNIFQRINNNLIFSILQVNYDRKFKSNQTESCFITKLLNIIIRGMINYKLVTLVKMQPLPTTKMLFSPTFKTCTKSLFSQFFKVITKTFSAIALDH